MACRADPAGHPRPNARLILLLLVAQEDEGSDQDDEQQEQDPEIPWHNSGPFLNRSQPRSAERKRARCLVRGFRGSCTRQPVWLQALTRKKKVEKGLPPFLFAFPHGRRQDG